MMFDSEGRGYLPCEPVRYCRHIGELLRLEKCPACSGNVRLKVFTCQVHNECTQFTTVGEIACCRVCPDLTLREEVGDT